MTGDETAAAGPGGPALAAVLARAGGPEVLDLLADGLSGTDLTTLLLEVFRRRAERLTPAEVMRRYGTDRFVGPAATPFAALRRVEDAVLSELPDGFETLVLAPVVPLATHTAVATVDPRKVVATIRGGEVAADPTNALALEAARRRARILAGDPRSTEPVRLAASQRVVRAQRFSDAPGTLAHFQLLGLVTAGRDPGNREFEHRQLTEHLAFAARAISAVGAERTEVRLTLLDEVFSSVVERTRESLAEMFGGASGVAVVDDPDRLSGRGYYGGVCYKVHATVAGQDWEVADGGFVDWAQRLTGNRKERLLIGGMGLDRLATVRA